MRYFNPLFLIILITLLSCEKEEETKPQIVFKANNKVLQSDTIKVPLNGYHEVIIETVGNNPKYFRQVNSQYPINLEETNDLRSLRQLYGTEKIVTVEVFTSFPDSIYSSEDIVRIKAQVSALTESIYYKIE